MYEYSVVRSGRRSVSITVSALNKIVIHCPYNFSEEKIEKFLIDKKSWIDRVLLKNDSKLSENADILSYNRIYVYGRKVPLYLNADKNGVSLNGVYIRNLKYVSRLYKKTFSESFLNYVKIIADTLRLVPSNVEIKDYKSRWGCCDAHNGIIFNYKIFMLPQNLQDYIIIHELCHIRFHNHSLDFWQLVGSYYPQYKACRKELKNYDFLTRLY